MRCSNNNDARFMWERWPNFNFITVPGNLFFPVHPFTLSSSLNREHCKDLAILL